MDKETQFFIGELSSKIKPLLNTLENLTKCGLQKYLELPRIAVVGAQSTGKTSVLESIIGRSILPKGNDLATRLPIVLMLKRDPFMKSGDYRYKIGKNPNEIEEISYEEVGDRVNEFQNELAGTNYEIVDKKIYIQISASHVPELTLVDLPGIAKNRRKESKQPDDIQSLTTGIVEEYIKDDSTIILAVSSANQDIQTADAIQLANKADRDGKRTIGVLTKLDLMDKGTDAKKILEGEIIELKLGFVGVINRSQEMVNNGELIENALENEKIFFKNHDVYRKMDPSYFGSPNLSIKLMSILSKKIAEQLPKIKEEVENNLEEIQIILDGFGKPLPLNKKEKDSFFWNTISSVCKNIIERLQGKNDSEDTDIDPNFFILELRKCSHSIENLAIMKDKDRHQLIKKIQKKNTSPLPLFNLFESFYEIIKSQMSKFERPGEDLLKSIHEKMETVSKRVIEEDLKRFPNLKKKLSSLILDLLKDKNVDTSKKLRDYYMMSKFPYTIQHDFIALSSMHPKEEKANVKGSYQITSPSKFQNNLMEIESKSEEILEKVEAYLKIQRQLYEDEVPKVIGHFLWDSFQESLISRSEIISDLKSDEDLLDEEPEISHQRSKMEKEKEVLEQSLVILNQRL